MLLTVSDLGLWVEGWTRAVLVGLSHAHICGLIKTSLHDQEGVVIIPVVDIYKTIHQSTFSPTPGQHFSLATCWRFSFAPSPMQ